MLSKLRSFILQSTGTVLFFQIIYIMSSSHTDQSPLKVRFIVVCPRTGSTLLMRVFTESAACAVTSRLVLMGNYGITKSLTPDYSILETPESHDVYLLAKASGKHFLINKEELGNDLRKGEGDYNVIPDADSYNLVKPVFLFRDPIRTFDSWKHMGWKDIDSLIGCYHNLFRMVNATAGKSYCLLYKRVISAPCTEIEGVCLW